MTRERDHAVDIMKGVGILLVILGHIDSTPLACKVWLYSFHMPLFFACSGLVFSVDRYDSFLKFAKARAKSVLIPLVCLGLALALLVNLREQILQVANGGEWSFKWGIKRILASLLLGHRLHRHYFSLWFLYVLFFGELAFYPIVKKGRDNPLLYAGLMVLGIAAQYLVSRHVRGWYWSLDLLPSSLAFLSMGYLLRLMRQKWKDRRLDRLLPVLLACHLLFCALNYRVCVYMDLYAARIGNPVYCLAAAFLGVFSMLILAEKLERLKLTEYFGRNTLVVYAFQNAFSIPIAMDTANTLAKRAAIFDDAVFRWIVVVLAACLVSCVLIEIINRCFPWLLGKRRGAGKIKSIRESANP